MDRTACTEPQCLYNGALYLFFLFQMHNKQTWKIQDAGFTVWNLRNLDYKQNRHNLISALHSIKCELPLSTHTRTRTRARTHTHTHTHYYYYYYYYYRWSAACSNLNLFPTIFHTCKRLKVDILSLYSSYCHKHFTNIPKDGRKYMAEPYFSQYCSALNKTMLKVIYSVNNTTYIANQYYKLGDMFWFTEPSSGQFLKQSNGTFSECTHYGIPYCLQIISTLTVMLNSVDNNR